MNSCALITGGTRGIGKGIALSLASQGYNIVVTHVSDMTIESKKKLLAEFADFNIKVCIEQANINDIEQCSALVERTLANFTTIEVLVNNAGITKDNLIMRMSSEDFSKVIDTNLNGTFNMTKVVSRHMQKKKYGRIINISSVIGLVGNIGQANYAASKAGIIGLSKSAALELASRNITVNCVAPGFIETDMTSILDEEIVKDIKNKIPVNKLGTVDDVANVVSFLAKRETSYITGQVINVCGGMVM